MSMSCLAFRRPKRPWPAWKPLPQSFWEHAVSREDMNTKQPAPPEWFKLDNAAKIYPAAKSRNWTALFRLSATLTEPVDPAILHEAQKAR